MTFRTSETLFVSKINCATSVEENLYLEGIDGFFFVTNRFLLNSNNLVMYHDSLYFI